MAYPDANTLFLARFDSITDLDEDGKPYTTWGRISAVNKKFGTSSHYGLGTSVLSNFKIDYFSGLNFGANPFTVDYWFYFSGTQTSSSTSVLIAYNADQWNLSYDMASRKIRFTINSVGQFLGSIAVSPNTWNHIEISRSTDVMYMFIGGVLAGSLSGRTGMSMPSTADGVLIFPYTIEYKPTYYLDEVRISNVCRHTENFLPPVYPYGTAPTKQKISILGEY